MSEAGIKSLEQPRKRIFYGWYVAIGLMLIFGIQGVVSQAPNVFYPFYGKELGMGPAELGSVVGIAFALFMLFSAVTGFLSDRLSLRWIIMTGAAITFVLGLFIAFAANSYRSMFVFGGVLSPLGLAFIAILPVMVLVRRWFVARAGLVAGMCMAMSGIFQGVFFPVLGLTSAAVGWRISWLYMAIATFVLIGLVALFMVRDRPEEKGLNPDGVSDEEMQKVREAMGHQFETMANATRGEALRSSQFWLFGIVCGLVSAADFGVIFHITSMAMTVGSSAANAGKAMSYYAFASIVGQVAAGWAGDKFGRLNSVRGATVLLACLYILAFFFVRSSVTLNIFLALAGLAMQLTFVVATPFIGDMFGLKNLGSIQGVNMLIGGVLGASGPALAGVIAGSTGNYAYFFFLGMVFYAIAFPLSFLIRPTRVQLANKEAAMKVGVQGAMS